jgi:hypothetical protein
LAKVDFAIIGADFLKHFQLAVDLAAKQLIDTHSMRSLTGGAAQETGGGLLAAVAAAAPQYRSLFSEYPAVADTSGKLPPAKHDVEHHLPTQGPPVTSRFRRLDAAKLQAAKAEFAKMEAEGVIRRSDSAWSSPLHMVQKPDGSWRPCGDYRRLNLVTQPDKYPVPNIQDLSARLHGCTIFSKLDLRKGYYQIPMAAADVPKTAVITPFGLFEFLRMPFGLKNAGQRFRRLMDRVLAGLDFVFIYLDDVIVGSRSEEEHLHHLRLVFARLQQFGLVLNMDKCHFGVQEVEFLGHSISSSGAKPLDKHVEAIRRFPRPGDAKQLQRFLGLVNFYRRFIPGAAGILKPLSDALRGQGRSPWQWSSAMEAAFETGKEAVCRATQLAHPDPEAEISLAADASDTHIGAVLQQKTATGWRPLSFYSKKLSATEERYSAFDRELWAVFSGIRHFRYLLEGRQFHVLTDHKPLTTALHRVSEPWSAKQQRQLAYIAEYTADIRYIAGTDNVVADALSRPGGATAAASPSAGREASDFSPPSLPGTDPLRVETRVRQPNINRPGP